MNLKTTILNFAAEEAGHARIFERLLRNYFDEEIIAQRAGEILAAEAEIMERAPIHPRVH